MSDRLPLETDTLSDEGAIAAAAKLRAAIESHDSEEMPEGDLDTVVRHSHAPTFTLAPNPFIGDVLDRDPSSKTLEYSAFVGELTVDERHDVYSYHPYHTKVPPQIIQELIEHYTEPGELVIDVFSGSGMTGVAARDVGRDAILVDLAPIACFIAGVNCSNHDVKRVTAAVENAIQASREKHGHLYRTVDSGIEREVNYFVWTDVFECPDCQHEFPFFPHGVEHDGKKVKTLSSFPCPSCDVDLNVRRVERIITSDGRKKKELAWVNAGSRASKVNRAPNEGDLELAAEIEASTPSDWFPTDEIDPSRYSAKLAQLGAKGVVDVSRFLSSRNLHVFADLWARFDAIEDTGTRVGCLSLLTSIYTVISERQGYFGGGGGMSGNLYMPIVRMEKNVYDVLERKLKKFSKAEAAKQNAKGTVRVSTQSATSLTQIPDASVDYVYTDPPFGANIIYSEMNLLLEGWLGVRMNDSSEAVIDETRDRGFDDYGDLMRAAFAECYRVLKPGRWMTVEFHNTKASVWNLIQSAVGEAGLVVAQVSILDKGSTTILADIRPAAAKYDLLISAYKPHAARPADIRRGDNAVRAVWDWTEEHLSKLPVTANEGDDLQTVHGRTPHVLFDHMLAYYIRQGAPVPISSADYIQGLAQRFVERDGMYFTSPQVTQYDRERMVRGEPVPPQLFVTDERSAVEWLRETLSSKPRSYQDLHAEYTRQVNWAVHEEESELRDLLEENFLRYDGAGPVPSQIHSYLSSNFASMRNKEKDDSQLRSKATDRWYVPDPAKEDDLRKLRNRTLLKQFEEYRTSSSKRLKEFRTEAVRAGFKDAYDRGDYSSIVAVAEKLPDSVLQEDEKLLMYYDVAQVRIGG